jgi:hypothetical protein
MRAEAKGPPNWGRLPLGLLSKSSHRGFMHTHINRDYMMSADPTDYARLSVGLSSGSVRPKGVPNAYGSQTICCARCVVHHPRPTLFTYPQE